MMHSFNLAIGSMLGHAWARELVVRAQKLVTYFRASHRPLQALSDIAKTMGINATPQSSNTTRFTSIHACLASLEKLEAAFRTVKQTRSEIIANKEASL